MSDATEETPAPSEISEMLLQFAEESLTACARDAAPTDDLVQVLALHTRDELDEYARELGLSGTSKLRKAELAERIAAEVVTPERVPYLEALLLDCSSSQFDTLRALAERPQGVTFELAELAEHIELEVLEPYANLFRQGDTLTALATRQVREALGNIDLDDVAEQRKREWNAALFLNTCAEFYGLASLDQVCAAYEEVSDDPLAPNELFALMDHEIQAGLACYDLWDNGGDLFLVEYTISDDYVTDVLYADGKDSVGQLAAEMRALNAYRRGLVAAHRRIELRPLDDLWAKDAMEHIFGLPEALALENFVTEHAAVGRGNARSVAQRAVEDLYDVRRTLSGYEKYRAYAAGLDVLDDATTPAQRATFRDLAAAFYDATPAWELGGWSPAEHRARTGDASASAVFPGDGGDTVKVGRNDPCPCGSGKKYKKCCGKRE